MTKKEDYLTALRHGVPESIPYYGAPVRCNIGFMDTFEKGPMGGGYDAYGVRWEFSNGTASPATDKFALTDPPNWKNQITFPDLDAINWKEKAEKEKEKKHFDPETMVMDYGMGNGPFERMLAWCGYEGLIDALLEYPDECHEIIDKWVEERKKFIAYVCEAYNPDCITIFDDVAFERGLFVTKDMYVEFFQPAHTEIVKCIHNHGVIAINHCCGKAQDLLENFIEEGYDAWTSCQPMNDIAGILEKYHDTFTIIGGYDSNGKPSIEEATEEERMAEVHRAIDEYAKWGSFILGNMIFMTYTEEERQARIKRGAEEIFRYGKDWYARNTK